MLQEGKQALEAHNFKRAEAIFTELAKKEPSATSYGYLAVAELSAGHAAESIAHFAEAHRLGNDSANLHYYWGLAYLQTKAQSPASANCAWRLAKTRNCSRRTQRSASHWSTLDGAKEAIPYLEQARSHSPGDAEIQASLVRAEFESGQTAAALAGIDSAVDAIPENSRLEATLAFLCLHHRQAQKARLLLENASELNPQDATLKLLLADASIKAGEPVEALAVLKGVPEEAGGTGRACFPARQRLPAGG